MKTKLDRSHELAYLKKYQGKKFHHKFEVETKGITPNDYTLGSLCKADQKVTIDWWKVFDEERKEQHAVDYLLADVLKYITIGDWIIIN